MSRYALLRVVPPSQDPGRLPEDPTVFGRPTRAGTMVGVVAAVLLVFAVTPIAGVVMLLANGRPASDAAGGFVIPGLCAAVVSVALVARMRWKSRGQQRLHAVYPRPAAEVAGTVGTVVAAQWGSPGRAVVRGTMTVRTEAGEVPVSGLAEQTIRLHLLPRDLPAVGDAVQVWVLDGGWTLVQAARGGTRG